MFKQIVFCRKRDAPSHTILFYHYFDAISTKSVTSKHVVTSFQNAQGHLDDKQVI